nr:hypothetical protein [Tanacetum cinerariifolium]
RDVCSARCASAGEGLAGMASAAPFSMRPMYKGVKRQF